MSNHILHTVRRHAILTGVVLTFALTWPVDLALAAQSNGRLPFMMPEWLGFAVGYGFVAAALIATLIIGGRSHVRTLLQRYLVWRVAARWYAVVLLLPAAMMLAALAVDVALGASVADLAQPFVRNFVPPIISLWVVAPLWLLFEMLTNGEEIFWRGYQLPHLRLRHGALVSSLLVGIVWAPWHLPKFAPAGVVGSAHDYPFWVFMVHIFAFSVLITWVFEHTAGSLLLATLFHASSNTTLMLLPIAVGGRAFYLSVAIEALAALAVVLVAGPSLKRSSGREKQPSFIPLQDLSSNS